MATAKPSTTKKKSTTTAKAAPKKSTAKKPVAKKTATKKPTAKKSTVAKAAPVRSFRLSREQQSFISTSITRQTVYWSIFAVVILIVGLMILQAQLSILETLNQISEQA